MQLVIYCQNALKDALGSEESGPEAGITPLAEAFARLSQQGRGILNEVLAECQDSLFYTVNPVLVADWLATRVFFLFAKERAIA
jgi:DNA polymerase-3 subunit delta'